MSGANTLVTVAPDGVTPANDDSFNAGIDATGRRVAFASIATNLVPGVTGQTVHVYARDLATGTTTLVDRTTSGAPAGADSEPQISANGAFVVFSSRNPDLPGAPGDGNNHVYRADLASGQIVLVDRSSGGAVANHGADHPDVSADGNRVAFASISTNLGGATSLKDDVYVRDLAAGTTTWASVPEDGDPGHSSARDPSISADGRRVAFTQELPEFGYGAIDEDEVFVRDLAAGTTTLASAGPAGPADTGAVESSLSGDGSKVTFVSDARNLGGPVGRFRTAYVRDLVTRTTSLVVQDGSPVSAAVLSANGACVALQAGELVAGYGPDFEHAFLHALGAGCAASGVPAPGADTTAPFISRLRMTRRRFAVGRRRTPLTARTRRGTAFVFRLSEDARTTITISRKQRRRVVLKRRTRAGTNRIAYTGRTRGACCAPAATARPSAPPTPPATAPRRSASPSRSCGAQPSERLAAPALGPLELVEGVEVQPRDVAGVQPAHQRVGREGARDETPQPRAVRAQEARRLAEPDLHRHAQELGVVDDPGHPDPDRQRGAALA